MFSNTGCNSCGSPSVAAPILFPGAPVMWMGASKTQPGWAAPSLIKSALRLKLDFKTPFQFCYHVAQGIFEGLRENILFLFIMHFEK